MAINPFKQNTASHHDWEHSQKCELKSGQAKTRQVWQQEKGIQLDKDEKACGIKHNFAQLVSTIRFIEN